MQAVIDACKNGRLNSEPSVLISNNSTSKAIERAKNENLPFYHISSHTHPYNEDNIMLKVLMKHEVDIVLLLGYMKKLGMKTLQHYRGRILNIHPSLLPKYGGKGMYGKYVHEAVLKAGEKVTGITIHTIDEEYDKGKIINQCKVQVLTSDTVESLSQRVLLREHEFIIETLKELADDPTLLV
jgi:phosphoribosylglycinamide formyltransferase-1